MARTSKRTHVSENIIAIQGTGQVKQGGKSYKAGIYARLSSDQTLKKRESMDGPNNSLETQIEIAEKYVEDWNRQHKDRIEVVDRYTDLGKTGTNFDRDAFQRLMQDIRLGDINCVIVKDLSRFGRNYLEAGNYIEKIFPFLGVRFIAVADGFDTGVESSHTGQIASEIKNLVNDMYAKDFSAKAKLSLKQRREEGSYVGGPPPYGYEAYMEGRLRKLRPDRNTAEIVRMIYQKFVETENCKAVADYLNTRRIQPPAIYKKSGEVYCPPGVAYYGWNRSSIQRIITNDIYSGKLVQGKSSITAKKEQNRVWKSEKEWVKIEDTHEPLIDASLHEQVVQIRKKIKERTLSNNHHTEDCPIEENIFDKVLYCGVCGKKMTRHSYVKEGVGGRKWRMDGYFCSVGGSNKTDCCPNSNRISKIELVNVLFSLFEVEFSAHLKKQKDYVEQGRAFIQQKTQELYLKLRQVEKQVQALSEDEGRKYMAYRSEKMSQEEYVKYRLCKDERLEELAKQKAQYEEMAKNLERQAETYLKAIRSLVKLKKRETLTKELVETLIEKIYVYPGKRVEVIFTYGERMD